MQSPESVIFVSGRELRLSRHILDNMAQRKILREWVVQVLTSPVAVVDDETSNSTNYYGVIPGRNPLLKVAVSRENDGLVATTYFDSSATARYRRGEL